MLNFSQGPVRLAILLSGRGTNAEAIIRGCAEGQLPGCEIAVVVSNVPGVPGIERARSMGVPVVVLEGRGRAQREHEEAIVSLLHKFRADLICLAGYKRLLSASFVKTWEGRILNVHPSLLPAFPGLNAQEQAVRYGVQFTGCTVHFVDESLDGGVIILQHALEVLDSDTVDSLTHRLLVEEHAAYLESIRRVISGNYEIRGRRYARKLPVATA